MKILMFNYEFPPLGGGAGNANYYLLKEFSKYKNVEIDLITSSTKKTKIEKFSDKIKVHYLYIGKNKTLHYQSIDKLLIYSWKALNYSKKLVFQKKFDFIHAFFGIPCGFIARQLNIPYIVSLRGSDVPFYNKRFKFLDILLFKNLSKHIWDNSRAVICNSEGLKKLALCSNPKAKISVIYNGVNLDEFKNCDTKKNDKLTLISTGRLIKRKGYEYLIRAIKNFNNINLILIGSGNIEKKLKKLAKKLNVNVVFIGEIKHNEVFNHLKKADLFILPSLNEGMSNSVLEAMSCGLPIIITNVGGSKELISGNGYVITKSNIEAIKKTILKYINNRNLLEEHGKKSREIAEKMSWNNAANEYFNIYQKLISSNPN